MTTLAGWYLGSVLLSDSQEERRRHVNATHAHHAHTPASLASSVLYRTPDNATVVLDIPRSLEESQVPLGQEQSALCRIYSSAAPTTSYSTPDPTNGGFDPNHDATSSLAAQIAVLMTQEHLSSTLQRLALDYAGPYCLPRHLPPQDGQGQGTDNTTARQPPHPGTSTQVAIVPPGSEYLEGSIQQRRKSFSLRAPKFHLIVLDPPWPNRSARRKTARYKTARSLAGIRELLLCAIPVPAHLDRTATDNSLVAIWITNKPRIADLVCGPGGLFDEWGLELVAEWTWLKVTAAGQPLFPLASAWRKPWEKLLVAKPVGRAAPAGLASKTILAVPDLHSRKPNLRGLFADILGPDYRGLEIFARGLTAGWWSWGDEVLKFQQPEHWHRPQGAGF